MSSSCSKVEEEPRVPEKGDSSFTLQASHSGSAFVPNQGPNYTLVPIFLLHGPLNLCVTCKLLRAPRGPKQKDLCVLKSLEEKKWTRGGLPQLSIVHLILSGLA